MKIKTNVETAYGKKINLPIDGIVEVGEDGIMEVSEKCAAILLNDSNYISAEDASEETEDGLDDLKLPELVQLAVDASYPEEEYKKFLKNKKLMIIYLRKKAEAAPSV